ncbi:zinc finger ccch domain-containing protein [Anaeramoeba flamelloides]|uniref:Zinc finger ccch domain-containing protein n=1 Tax=Anaeramoeba flamelloides TaxID=1746091 RepID=A0AAV8A9N0_9EUKA|nr:zinc finger ccch domain-containing protein [Anaeramoeba flamelloides]
MTSRPPKYLSLTHPSISIPSITIHPRTNQEGFSNQTQRKTNFKLDLDSNSENFLNVSTFKALERVSVSYDSKNSIRKQSLLKVSLDLNEGNHLFKIDTQVHKKRQTPIPPLSRFNSPPLPELIQPNQGLYNYNVYPTVQMGDIYQQVQGSNLSEIPTKIEMGTGIGTVAGVGVGTGTVTGMGMGMGMEIEIEQQKEKKNTKESKSSNLLPMEKSMQKNTFLRERNEITGNYQRRRGIYPREPESDSDFIPEKGNQKQDFNPSPNHNQNQNRNQKRNRNRGRNLRSNRNQFNRRSSLLPTVLVNNSAKITRSALKNSNKVLVDPPEIQAKELNKNKPNQFSKNSPNPNTRLKPREKRSKIQQPQRLKKELYHKLKRRSRSRSRNKQEKYSLQSSGSESNQDSGIDSHKYSRLHPRKHKHRHHHRHRNKRKHRHKHKYKYKHSNKHHNKYSRSNSRSRSHTRSNSDESQSTSQDYSSSSGYSSSFDSRTKANSDLNFVSKKNKRSTMNVNGNKMKNKNSGNNEKKKNINNSEENQSSRSNEKKTRSRSILQKEKNKSPSNEANKESFTALNGDNTITNSSEFQKKTLQNGNNIKSNIIEEKQNLSSHHEKSINAPISIGNSRINSNKDNGISLQNENNIKNNSIKENEILSSGNEKINNDQINQDNTSTYSNEKSQTDNILDHQMDIWKKKLLYYLNNIKLYQNIKSKYPFLNLNQKSKIIYCKIFTKLSFLNEIEKMLIGNEILNIKQFFEQLKLLIQKIQIEYGNVHFYSRFSILILQLVKRYTIHLQYKIGSNRFFKGDKREHPNRKRIWEKNNDSEKQKSTISRISLPSTGNSQLSKEKEMDDHNEDNIKSPIIVVIGTQNENETGTKKEKEVEIEIEKKGYQVINDVNKKKQEEEDQKEIEIENDEEKEKDEKENKVETGMIMNIKEETETKTEGGTGGGGEIGTGEETEIKTEIKTEMEIKTKEIKTEKNESNISPFLSSSSPKSGINNLSNDNNINNLKDIHENPMQEEGENINNTDNTLKFNNLPLIYSELVQQNEIKFIEKIIMFEKIEKFLNNDFKFIDFSNELEFSQNEIDRIDQIKTESDNQSKIITLKMKKELIQQINLLPFNSSKELWKIIFKNQKNTLQKINNKEKKALDLNIDSFDPHLILQLMEFCKKII